MLNMIMYNILLLFFIKTTGNAGKKIGCCVIVSGSSVIKPGFYVWAVIITAAGLAKFIIQ